MKITAQAGSNIMTTLAGIDAPVPVTVYPDDQGLRPCLVCMVTLLRPPQS
jgi:hypothetical protein